MSDPSFWRTEIWHPLSLHFPIALLLLATGVKLIALSGKKDSRYFWRKAGSYLLYLGIITAWLSIYTGNLADGLVSRKICDPTILKDHQLAAYKVAYLFSAAALLDLGLHLNLVKIKLAWLTALVFILMLTGSGFLVYTSHLGARVVYQQAGGVQVPPSDCAGFN